MQLKLLNQSPQLDDLMQRHDQAVFSEVDCLTCANCCKTTGPLFRQEDIDRIAALLDMSVGAFILQYLEMVGDGDFVLQNLPCAFLDEENKCTIYEHRPLACATYPHTGQKNQKGIWALTLKNIEICPAALEVLRRSLSRFDSKE